MIFERPSTRTRVSFDVGMRELGGETIMLTGAEMQLGRGETLADTARVLSRYVDAIMIRILDPNDLAELARLRHRACDQRAHQAIASLPGDGRHPHLRGASRPDRAAGRSPGAATTTTCCRRGSTPRRVSASISPSPAPRNCSRRRAASPRRAPAGARIVVSDDPEEAVADASAVISDCWVSMGDEDAGRRHNLLAPYQVNRQVDAARRTRMRSSCIACPPIAARRSPTR